MENSKHIKTIWATIAIAIEIAIAIRGRREMLANL